MSKEERSKYKEQAKRGKGFDLCKRLYLIERIPKLG